MVNSTAIKKRLQSRSMTQSDLAKELKIKPATMNQKINNIRPFSLNEVEITAHVLGISYEEFGEYFFAQELRSATEYTA